MTSDDEVEGVIQKITELKKHNAELRWSDFAILVRSNDAAIQFTNYLKKADLPYNFLALRGLYTKPVILDVLAYFKMLDNYHESPSLFRVLTTDHVDIIQEDLVKIMNYANKKTISLYEALRRLTEVIGVSQDAQVKVRKLLALIEKHTKIAEKRGVLEVFLAYMQDSGILPQLLKEESSEDVLQMEYLQAFFKRIKNLPKKRMILHCVDLWQKWSLS
jgi:DNA helicase-2/ATP-dependent DNA helicase PcrA